MPTNVQRLQSAGILSSSFVPTPEDDAVLNSLTSSEVDAIIAIRDKLGDDFLDRHFVSFGCDFIF